MNKAYNKIVWQNKPSTASPLNQTNLNKMSDALDIIDDRVIALDSGKVSSVTVTNTLATGDTIATITVDGTSTNIKSAQITVDSEISTTSTNPVQNKVIAEALREVMPEVTVEGNPISITDGSNIVPAKLAEVTFLPKQDLHGYDSPWIGGAGKNKFDSDLASGKSATDKDVIFSYNSTTKKFSVSGTPSSSGAINAYILGAYNNTIPIFTLKAGTYTFSVSEGSGVIFYTYDGVTRTGFACSSSGDTVTLNADTPITALKPTNKTSGVQVDESFYIQIESGNQKTAWTPYSNECPISGWTEVNLYVDEEQTLSPANTYTATLGSTYYGGKVDFVSGKCVIDRVLETVTAVVKNTNTAFYYIPASTSDKVFNHVVSDKLPTASAYGGKGVFLNTGGAVIFSTEDEYETASAMITAYGGSIDVCFYLATPIELTLTPQEIELLKGNNVISSDGNSIKLVYSADIKAWVESQLQNS